MGANLISISMRGSKVAGKDEGRNKTSKTSLKGGDEQLENNRRMCILLLMHYISCENVQELMRFRIQNLLFFKEKKWLPSRQVKLCGKHLD